MGPEANGGLMMVAHEVPGTNELHFLNYLHLTGILVSQRRSGGARPPLARAWTTDDPE